MKRQNKIKILKTYKEYLLYLNKYNKKPMEKEKQKVLVLRKNFYGRDLMVG